MRSWVLSTPILATLALAAAMVAGTPANAADEVPAALPATLQFVRNPDLRDAELSPSGRWLAVATPSMPIRFRPVGRGAAPLPADDGG